MAVAVALVLVVVVVGSVMFHLLSPWWWTPIASNWRYIDHADHHLLDHRHRVRRRRSVHGLLRLPFPPSGAAKPALRAGEQAARVVADRCDGVGVAAMLAPGLFVWHQFVTGPE